MLQIFLVVCDIYDNHMVIKVAINIINSHYDNFYLGINYLGYRILCVSKAILRISFQVKNDECLPDALIPGDTGTLTGPPKFGVEVH